MNSKRNILGKITEKTRIYRIFPRSRFFQLFAEKQNTLVLPTMWDDPFENVILRAEITAKAGEKGQFGFTMMSTASAGHSSVPRMRCGKSTHATSTPFASARPSAN